MTTTQLPEIFKANIGRSSYEMSYFFQDLVDKKELFAYSVKIDKEVVDLDTVDERIARTIKGASLESVKKLEERGITFVEDSKTRTMYNLDIGSYGGMFTDDGDSQTVYHHCNVERLVKDYDIKRISEGGFGSRVAIPSDMISARLRMSYDEDWEGSEYSGDRVVGTRNNLIVEGESDKLFKKVIQFVKSKK